MKKTGCVKALSMLLACLMLLGAVVVVPVGSVTASAAGTTSDEIASILNAESYAAYAQNYTQYLAAQQGKEMPTLEVDLFDFVSTDVKGDKSMNGLRGSADEDAAVINPSYTYDVQTSMADFTPSSGYLYKLTNFKDHNGASFDALFTPDSGTVTWTVEVPRYDILGLPNTTEDRGYLYMLQIEYYPTDAAQNVATVERSLSIDSSVPFAEARALAFSKNWVYGYEETVDGISVVRKSYRLQDATGSTIFSGTSHNFKYARDKGDNDIGYISYQDPQWRTYTASDIDGFHHGSFYFFLKAGEPHTISISGSRENLVIKSIKLVPAQYDELISYTEYRAQYAGAADNAKNGEFTLIEAEFPTSVSDTSVSPSNDRSSAITSPSSPAAQWMNTIGATSYNTVGQWAAYTFQVSEDGWYDLTMRYRQNLLDGLFVSRTIKLWSDDGAYGLADGTPTVPFAEAYNTRFNYSKEWVVAPLGDANNAFEFYFKKGVTYTLYLEVSLGDLSSIIKTVEESLTVINQCYLDIIKLTGAAPDKYRDYGFNELMPDTITALRKQAKTLENISAQFVELCGSKGSQVATLDQIAILLNKMGYDEDEIASNLSNLKSNIGTLGTWLNTCKQQSLLVDYIRVQAVDDEEPTENANFFQSIWFELRAFFSSFFVDYNSMGVVADAEAEATIDVWLAYGRDQSLIWRSLIDTQFTPNTNIAVNLKLVAAGTLLPSVLSGQGPNVYIGLSSTDTINYAIRGAIESVEALPGYIETYGYDITLTEQGENDYTRTYYVDPSAPGVDASKLSYYSESDPEYAAHQKISYTTADGQTSYKYEVKKDSIAFNYANTIPISLLGRTYGVPETTNFPMMFYRMDVLADLEIDIPDTWDDLMESITVLQSHNMQIGLTYMSAMTTFVYQMGGSQWKYESSDPGWTDPSYYKDTYAGAQIGYGSDIALDAFQFCCRLYTDYSFPITFDAANRFRTGELPIVITDYCSMYNTLTVFATEIRGLWSFTRLPGMLRDDGTINNCSIATQTSTVMLHKKDGKDTEKQTAAAWEYMRWQAGADAQADYGNQMVALVGPAAKYATANTQALRNLSWTSSELDSLLEQFDNLASVPNYPGSYIISRYVQFAFLAAVNSGADPVDEMNNYVKIINDELSRKRQEFDEFNFEILDDGEYPEGYDPDR